MPKWAAIAQNPTFREMEPMRGRRITAGFNRVAAAARGRSQREARRGARGRVSHRRAPACTPAWSQRPVRLPGKMRQTFEVFSASSPCAASASSYGFFGRPASAAQEAAPVSLGLARAAQRTQWNGSGARCGRPARVHVSLAVRAACLPGAPPPPKSRSPAPAHPPASPPAAPRRWPGRARCAAARTAASSRCWSQSTRCPPATPRW